MLDTKSPPDSAKYSHPAPEVAYAVERQDLPILMNGMRAVSIMLAERLASGDSDQGTDCDAAFLLHDLSLMVQRVVEQTSERLSFLELRHGYMDLPKSV